MELVQQAEVFEAGLLQSRQMVWGQVAAGRLKKTERHDHHQTLTVDISWQRTTRGAFWVEFKWYIKSQQISTFNSESFFFFKVNSGENTSDSWECSKSDRPLVDDMLGAIRARRSEWVREERPICKKLSRRGKHWGDCCGKQLPQQRTTEFPSEREKKVKIEVWRLHSLDVNGKKKKKQPLMMEFFNPIGKELKNAVFQGQCFG